MSGDLWGRSRRGSHAGRGFRYQDAVATEVAVRAWRGELGIVRIVPEGLEDISLETDARWLHLQAKSRREQRGDFTLPELADAWRHLAERLAVDGTARAVLVLERPLPGVESSLDRSLADSASSEVKSAVEAAVGGVIVPADFLARAHVLVMPTPADTAISLIAEALARSPATCVPHEAILRSRLGELADENGVRGAADAASMSAADIARLIDDITEATDPSALDEAVREGVAELVDFVTPVEADEFFQGVDVVPGHIVAGLPVPRPEVDQLIDGLAKHRVALAIGPSGAGKSALVWLAAFATRHAVRWYRVRRLHETDVPTLVRLVKSQRGIPLGLVVDDLGREDRAGFDRLSEELRDFANVQVLGACREEDLFVVQTAHRAAQVRPVLTPDLAERIWRELRDSGSTEWPAWREPYESSESLLLEYGHLLTRGARLAETVTSQVDRRVRDGRSVELDVLGIVATADAYGAEVDLTRLVAEVHVDPSEIKEALTRLIDEHLVTQREGVLCGLHEVRSRHVMSAIHRVPPPTMSATASRVIGVVTAGSMQSFLVRFLLHQPDFDEVVIEALVSRLTDDGDLREVAAAMHALRLAGFRRSSAEWCDILLNEGASPTDIEIIGYLALHGGTDASSIFPEPVQRAVARIRELPAVDLRHKLLPRLVDTIAANLSAVADLTSATVVLAALAEIGTDVDIDPSGLARVAESGPLSELRMLLEAAYVVSPDLAAGIAERLGGEVVTLGRLEREVPWVRNARLGTDDDGRRTAEAEYAYVAESAQPKPHDEVVEVARYLRALAPTVEIAVCRAIDATGNAAGYGGSPIADKAIPRENLPTRVAIAWNRARTRAAIAGVAAATTTEYAFAARDLVAHSRRLAEQVGETWARGKRPSQKLIDSAIALATKVDALRPPPLAVGTAGPLDEGELPGNDPVSFIGRMIPNNLMVRLFQGENVAPMIPQIIEHVDKVVDVDVWRVIDGPPAKDLSALRLSLVDLYAVVAEQQANEDARAAIAAAGKKGLAPAAAAARYHADARAREALDAAERALANDGFHCQVLRREGPPDSFTWPNDDVLVLIEVDSIWIWARELQAIAGHCRAALGHLISFRMAPVREGRVLASWGVKVITDVFPDDSVHEWPGLVLVEEVLGDAVRPGLAGLCAASGIVASIRSEEVHDDEVAALDSAAARALEALERLTELASERDDTLLTEVASTFAALGEQVEDECAALREGSLSDKSLAASLIEGVRGDVDDTFSTVIGMVAACAEWDVDPNDAWSRFEQADA